MTKQWHPAFVQLLRPSVQGHYEVKTNVAVGDAPRLADILLLRRVSRRSPPFRGLWRHLTTWNVLEFKGPTVSPRNEDLDLLVELGLGIHRRLNEERERDGEAPVSAGEVSFWYLANHLGSRLIAGWREQAGGLDEVGEGLWQGTVLRRPVFLVSGADLPVERDSLPLHLVGKGSAETEHEVARFLVEHPKLWHEYGGWLAAFHQGAYQEVEAMAKTKRRNFEFNLEPLIETMGVEAIVKAVGAEAVIKALTSGKALKELSPETCRELIEVLRQKADSPANPSSK
jgi:hypothetical protein